MIGVVLWSNAAREKAIIWCEDHAALAYLKDRADLIGEHWPESGDLVELDYEDQDLHRMARRVSLISAPGKSKLPGILRGMAEPAPTLRVISNDEFDPAPQPRRVAAAG